MASPDRVPGPASLIVEDHPMVRDGLRALAIELDPSTQVEAAATLEEAVALLAGVQRFSLMCLDLGLPGYAGLAALWTVRETAPDLAVAVFSAADDPDTMRRALACGARGFIPKHSAPTVVADALRLILRGGTYVPLEALADVRIPERRAGPQRASSPRGWDGLERRTTAVSAVDAAKQASVASLTPRSREVMDLIGRGLTNKHIARELNVSLNTVKTHVARLFDSLGVHGRRDIYELVMRRGGAPAPRGK